MIRVSMPGNKVKWPFEKKEDARCVHIGLGTARRKFFRNGAWLCEQCIRDFVRG